MIDHNALLPDEYLPTAEQVAVHIDEKPVRVIRYAHFDHPLYFVHVSFTDTTRHTVSVAIKRKQKQLYLHPARHGVSLEPDKKGCHFSLEGHPYLVLECDALGYVVFAFDPPQDLPVGDDVLSVEQVGITPHPHRVQTTDIQAALHQVSASSSLHTLLLPRGIYRSGDLHIPSNCRIHLASGAVLLASDKADDIGDATLPGYHRDRARFIDSENAETIAITGHGHIDGNRRVLDLQGYFKGMVTLRECREVTIDGPVFSDACGWSTTPRFCDGVTVRRLKILNNRPEMDCINTDGCNPDGSSNVLIDHCLMHTGDDAVAVKSSAYGGKTEDVSNITVRDLLAINNSATAKVGTETMAVRMEHIHFERIDAVHTTRLAVIDAYDVAAISDVTFTDCHVHALDGRWHKAYVIDIQAPAEAFRKIPAKATVRGVTLKNISSDCEGGVRILNREDADGPAITEVIGENISVNGVPVSL